MDIALDQFSEFEEFSPQETLNLRSPISKSHLPISSAFHLSRSLSSLTKHSQNWDFDSHLASWPQPFHIDCGAVSQMLQSSWYWCSYILHCLYVFIILFFLIVNEPESNYCQPLSVTHWLTHSLLFSGLDWCDTSCWKCQLKTSWCFPFCWCWHSR